MRWIVFGAVALWLLAVSIRLGLDEFDHAINLNDHYIPYRLAPFSNDLDDGLASTNKSTPRHLLAVDGKPFLGASTYLRALPHLPDLGIREDAQPVRTFRAHCSCPVSLPNTILAASFPTLLICIGLGIVALDPRDFRRWVFLTLTLSLPHFVPWQRLMQLSSLPVYRGFFNFADVREWDDFMRIPALIQQTWFAWSWPGSVLLFLAPAGNGRALTWIAASPFTAYAMLQVLLAVAWSESYVPFAGFYAFSQAHTTIFFAIGLLAASLYLWTLGRLPGTIATLASVCTLAVLQSLPAAPSFQKVDPSTLKPVFLVQWTWRTPGNLAPFALLGYWHAFLMAPRTGSNHRTALFGVLPLLALSAGMAIDWIDALHTTEPWPVGYLDWPRTLPFYVTAALAAIACSAPVRSKAESHPLEKCVCDSLG